LPARARVEPAPAGKPGAIAGSILDPPLATEIEEQDRSTRWQLASPSKTGVAFCVGLDAAHEWREHRRRHEEFHLPCAVGRSMVHSANSV
jgi:hypothetical protein